MSTTVFSPTEIDTLLNPMRELFSEFDVNFKEDQEEIEIKNSSVTCIIEIDKEDLLAELGFQKAAGSYYTITESSLRVLLIDEFDSVKNFLGSDPEKVLTDNTQGLTISLKSAKESSLLTLNNVNLIYNHLEIESNQTYTLESFIDDEFIICEINFERSFGYQEIVGNEEKFINSLIAHLSFQKNITLTNPMDLSYSYEINDPISDNNLTFSVITEKEPLNYFLFAEKTEYIHLKFLEYYHVIEYYFYQRRISQMEEILERLMNTRLLNRFVDRQPYYDDLNKIWESYYVVNNSKLNEEDELRYILNNHIGFDQIVYSLKQIPDFEKILTKVVCGIKDSQVDLGKVSKKISGVQVFNNNNTKEDTARFCNELASRIYKIRNFIVHSKKFGSETLFLASKEQLESLSRDLPIIRSIAYIMLGRVY